ncbi:MAG: cytochrome C oxidase subunit IV family protein, partial [Rhodospirillales bacterium]|nr:cytochrome C oxidase subunit IV family protein [Rhodospirillales bacterium]
MSEPTHRTTESETHAHAGEAHHAHVVPLSLLAGVFGALLFLTLITVAATWIDLGALNVWVAVGIAVVKAAFVALYFMHLRWDSPFNSMV